MEKIDSALCQWIALYIHYFNFLILMHSTNQITLQQSLLNLIFRVSSTKRHINIPLWTHMGHKGWKKDGKTFTRCYTIALKFWDESNANFVLLYFLSYRTIKNLTPLLQEYEEKNRQCIKVALHLSSPKPF